MSNAGADLQLIDCVTENAPLRSSLGPFKNYVNRILTIFDHLPTPSKQT